MTCFFKRVPIKQDDPEVAAITTSCVELWEDDLPICTVGAMRPMMLGPVYLWFELQNYSLRALREMRPLMKDLHELLNDATLWAEVSDSDMAATRFIKFLGFVPAANFHGLTLYRKDA